MSIKHFTMRHESSGREWTCDYDPHPITGIGFRMKGLLGRTSLEPYTAIWLKPCSSIHMFFMKFPIDAIFLDRENRIVKIVHSIQPWSLTSIIPRAHSCVEMGAGEALAAGFTIGDKMEIISNP